MMVQETITDVSGIFESSGSPNVSSLLWKLQVWGRSEKVGKTLKNNFG